MCWKCCLCLCCCSQKESAQRSLDIERQIAADRAELEARQVRSIETKNWVPFQTVGDTYFIHGSGAAPNLIKTSGGLNPAFGREDIRVGGESGKYLLAFKTKGNVVPDEYVLSGAAKVLWGSKDFPYIYVFHLPAARLYQSQVRDAHQVAIAQTEARENAEIGINQIVPWANIDRVFQVNATGKYDRNPIE